MDELQDLKDRLVRARSRLRELPQIGAGQAGPPDPSTGEAWNRGHVLGHVAEMLPFWTAQVGSVLAGEDQTGRGEEGYARRRQGIDAGPEASEAELRARIDASVDQLILVLGRMEPSDLRRPIHHRAATGERDTDLAWLVKDMLVAHLEEHVKQFSEVS